MVNVKPGMELDVSTRKSGNGQRGAWCLFNVKADKGSNRITVWADNAEEAASYTQCVVGEIINVKYGNKKGADGSTWYPDVSVTCTVTGVDANKVNKNDAYNKFMQNADFMDIPSGNADGLPFV